MADLTAGAFSSLIPKLGELLKEEYNLQTGVKERVRTLYLELEGAHAALRKVAQVPWDELDEEVKLWAREVRESSYDMEDVLDTFLVRVQGRDDSAKQKESLEQKTANLFKKSKARRDISVGVKDIMNHLDKVAKLCRRYKEDDIVAKPATTLTVDPRLVAMYNKVQNLVGIDKASGEFISLLQTEQRGDVPNTKVKIVSVVGVGGLGKTTLAKAVYDKLKGNFEHMAFVLVGRNPVLKKVFQHILIELDKKRYMQFNFQLFSDIDQYIGELKSFLQSKRYFIVIDDIWEVPSWKAIKLAFDDDNNCGARIIITTRKMDVAERASEVYKLRPLSDESSRELFYTRMYADVGSHVDNKQDEISDKILKKCSGIPLAIITMASLLADKPMDRWAEIYKTIGFGHKDSKEHENTTRILSFSYYELPSHLRACLLYLSAFPEDSSIAKVPLIWKWVAEGFIHEEQGTSLFEIGEGYFNELINRSLIQPVESNFGDSAIYGCRVHDMVLDFIRSMSLEENFISVVDEESHHILASNCHRLAIHNRKEGQNLGDHTGLRKCRSLFAIGCPIYMIPPIYSFSLLRVLALESCGSMEGYDLKHFGILLHLRFIGLNNTFVRRLPDTMGHLKSLQTVELEGSGVEELPSSMGELTGLMRLNVDWTTRLPDWIGKLTSLQELVIYPGGGNDEYSAFLKGLGNLRELRALRFLIKAQDEGQLRDLLQSLSNLPKVEVLYLDYYGVQLTRGVRIWELSADFTLSRNLRTLELCWLEFSRLPVWINVRNLPNLCRLWLMILDVNEQDLQILGQFPVLRDLHMQTVNTERGDVITSNGSGACFHRLEFCSITTPLKFEEGAMPSLQVLDFRFNVRLLCDSNQGFDFDFGLRNLLSLRHVIVEINCVAAVPEEMEKAEAALWHAINSHPNRPILNIFSLKSETEDDGTTNICSSDQAKEATKNEPVAKIINKLSMPNSEADNKKMIILSILRSEGQGTTALAKKVFDEHSPQFDCGAFVLLGQNPDLRKVFTGILTSLDKQKFNDFSLMILDLMELIGLVRKSLIHKRFFVVVDDIWDFKSWEIIKCALIENNNRSAVLTTSHDICITSDIGGVEQFASLSEIESKRIFYKKLFGSEDTCPLELETMCRKLIKKCEGTLSVIDETVTSLSNIPQTMKDWKPVYDSRIFALSYPKLPDHLKKCLLFFRMFRRDYEINGERLVWAWIAEDLVQKTHGTSEQTLQDVGERYLCKLVREKMIEALEVDAGGMALSCRAYKFVHDFVISMSTEENFPAILNDSQGRALPDAEVLLSLSKPLLPQVKSLIVSCDYLQASHLKGISTITSLRHLAIGGKCMARIPKEIKKLENLHTLDLSASDLNELPRSVFSLTKLERLCVNSHMKMPSSGIQKMTALQELGEVNILQPKLLKKLRKLSKLRILRIAIWSWDESLKTSIKQLYDNLGSLVGSMENIQCLSIVTCCNLDFMADKWVVPQSLKKLEIRCSAFDRLPSWFDSSLSSISSLTIEVYRLSPDIIGTLGMLPALRSLSLTSKEVPKAYFVIDSDRFTNLASLKFVSNAMVQMFDGPQSNGAQQLKRLTIVFQASRTEEINNDFTFGLEYLSSLEHARAEIICFNASLKTVDKAEAAIREAISRGQSSNLELEMRRLEEENVIGDQGWCGAGQKFLDALARRAAPHCDSQRNEA